MDAGHVLNHTRHSRRSVWLRGSYATLPAEPFRPWCRSYRGSRVHGSEAGCPGTARRSLSGFCPGETSLFQPFVIHRKASTRMFVLVVSAECLWRAASPSQLYAFLKILPNPYTHFFTPKNPAYPSLMLQLFIY